MEPHDIEEPSDDFYGQDADVDPDVPPDLPASSPAPSPVCEPEPAPAPAVTVAPQSDLSSPALRSLPIDVQAAVLRTA